MNPPRYKRCAFIGYRPSRLGFDDECDARCVEFKSRIRDMIEDLIGKGYAHFLSGGSIGLDLYAAEAVLDLREKYPWIILEMVSPCDEQAALWDSDHQMRLDRLYGAADRITPIAHHYQKGCYLRRNRYLVVNADLVVAAFDGQPGGRAMTCDYARELGIPVQTIMPRAKRS